MLSRPAARLAGGGGPPRRRDGRQHRAAQPTAPGRPPVRPARAASTARPDDGGPPRPARLVRVCPSRPRYHRHIGSTRWLSKTDGTFPNGIRYTAYGQKASLPAGTDWQPVDFLFAGECGYITEYSDQQLPGLGLLYLQQRYYDPDVGRFLTPDPIGFAGGLNLYAYCGNDPVNRVDPSGTDDVDGDGDDDGIPIPPVGTPGQIGTGGPPMCSPVRNSRPVSAFPSRAVRVTPPSAVVSSPGMLSRAGGYLRAQAAAARDWFGGLFSRKPAARPTSTAGSYCGSARTPTDNTKEHLDSNHMNAVVRERRGEVLGFNRKGNPFNHAAEVRNTQNCLKNRIHVIRKQLGNPDLTGDARTALVNELSQASRLLDESERYVR